jgi:hypothetical protein
MDLLFLNPLAKIKEGLNFYKLRSDSKFMCCGTTLMIGRPLLYRKEPKHVGKRFGGSEETKDPRGCGMHIVFQEVHNILNPETELLNRLLCEQTALGYKCY